ncbi:interleukin-6 receptor subunit beta [Mantella aurantiaca]
MIIFYIVCFYGVLIAAGESSLLHCAFIDPQIFFVEVSSNVTTNCILNQTCVLQYNQNIKSDDLYWEVDGRSIPQSHYVAINESASRVTFQPTSTSHNILTCMTNLHGQIKTTLAGMIVDIGFPPEKPRDLSCVCYNKDTLTCTWNPGRPTIIPTTYILKQSWKEDNRPDCQAKETNNSCTWKSPNFQLFIDTTFQVVAKNELGIAESDELRLDIVEILKPNPPKISNVDSVAQLQKALLIKWDNPLETSIFPMKYNLRYRRKDSTEWEQVPPNDIENTRISYTLQDLQPYTKYIISLRCKQLNNKGFWSDWSTEYEAITPESAPSQGPELWRKLGNSDSDGNWTVWLMWKDLKSYANGKILGYNISILTATKSIAAFSVSDRQCNVSIPNEALQVSIVAYNSYGVSPPSILVIPDARNRVTFSPEISVKAFSEDEKLWVEWTAPAKFVLGYVIEWCANSDFRDCNMEWQRESNSVTRTFLRGDLKPFVRYRIKVYPLYRSGLERPRYDDAYLKQGIPEQGPVVRCKSVGKTTADIVWEPVPLEKQNGFITNYTLKYEAKNGQVIDFTLNATETEYRMTFLTANTVYRVSVVANTVVGGMEGLPFTFSTNKFDTGEVEAIVVSSCIGFLLLVLFSGILLCNKRDLIKKHIWPNVPDPSKSNIAQWSPQTPTRHEPKSHPFQDGSFTDVSVVEITDDDKSSYSKQELKSVDVMKKNTSEGLSSGIGGSSCLSSPQLSISDTDEVESGQNTSSTIQYSTVIISGYRGQQPTPAILPIFSRSESTQPLLESEERPDEQQVLEIPNQYFKQNCTQEDSAGRPQALQQENLSSHTHEPGQSQHLAGLGPELNPEAFNVGQIVNLDSQPASSEMDNENTEIKSYLPQTERRGGYLPQ